MDIPSVAGDCRKILDRAEKEFSALGLPLRRTRKGALLATMKGRIDGDVRVVSCHADTLGAVVREIKPNGRLRLLQIGGFAWTSFETDNLLVRTASGREIRGSLLPEKASIPRLFRDCPGDPPTDENMEVRLDEPVPARRMSGPRDRGGGFRLLRPALRGHRVGLVKSRFLDDKACVPLCSGR
jgi:putative aminopeptidase FrvX